MITLFKDVSLHLCTGLLLAVASLAGAQPAASYPNKPVRIVVPYAPGGASDLLARALADRLTKELSHPFILDNRAGGGTIIGTNTVAKAAADGYTLLVTTEAFFANHWLPLDLPYDSLKDFALITPLGRSESVLTVHPSVATKTLGEFIAYAKANPGKLNVAVTSAVGVINLHKFNTATATKFTIVNYNGGAPAITDLLSGNVQVVIFNALNVQSLIKAGKLRGLAISGDKRDSALPEVPTFAESSVQNFDPAGPVQYPWLAPNRTPKDIIEKLNAQARRALAHPELMSRLDQMRVTPVPTSVTVAEKLLRSELERYGKLVKDSGLKPGAL